MAALEPGFAFSMPTDVGFMVGLLTHEVPSVGSVIWVAEPTYEDPPTLKQAETISEWRWPTLFPLAAAARRGIVAEIGRLAIPDRLKPFPAMRSGSSKLGWVAFTYVDGVRRLLGNTSDRSLPVYEIVNDTRLKEMINKGWTPEDDW